MLAWLDDLYLILGSFLACFNFLIENLFSGWFIYGNPWQPELREHLFPFRSFALFLRQGIAQSRITLNSMCSCHVCLPQVLGLYSWLRGYFSKTLHVFLPSIYGIILNFLAWCFSDRVSNITKPKLRSLQTPLFSH